MGVTNVMATSTVGTLLALLPSVREWKPADGPLRLSLREAYDTPAVKDILQKLLAEKSPLVRRRREGNTGPQFWELNADELTKELGK